MTGLVMSIMTAVDRIFALPMRLSASQFLGTLPIAGVFSSSHGISFTAAIVSRSGRNGAKTSASAASADCLYKASLPILQDQKYQNGYDRVEDG